MYKYKNILVPVDFSEGSENALSHAVDLAKAMNAKIHLVHVMSPVVYPTGIEFAAHDIANIEKDLEKGAYKQMHNMKSELEKDNIDCHLQLLMGKADVQLLAYAKDENIDIITISTHGVSGFEHFIFGSTTEKIMRKAKCPVLVVHLGQGD